MENKELILEFSQRTTTEFQNIINRIVEIIQESNISFNIAIKWKQLTFAIENDFHHWICSINITKKFVGLNFHFGGLLEDPDNHFLSGTSKFLRKLEFKNAAEINSALINNFLIQATKKLPYFKENWKSIQNGK